MGKEISKVEKVLIDTFTFEGAVTQFERDKGITLCEIIHHDEVYLLVKNPDYNPADDESKPFVRGRRICGRLRIQHPKPGDNRKFRCLMGAGHGTNHAGYGCCMFHMGSDIKGSTNRFTRIIKDMKRRGLALEYSELEVVQNELLRDSPEASDISYEIQILEFLLVRLTNEDKVVPDEIRKTIEALVKAKSAKAKIETERLTLDVSSIKAFVRVIFEILQMNLGSVQYSKVVGEIEKKLAFPVNQSMQRIINAEVINDDKRVS